MAKLFRVQSTLEGNGAFVVQNTTPSNSGANGVKVKATLDVSNLTEGETIVIKVEGKEVANVSADGVQEFTFQTNPFYHANNLHIGYEVSNVGKVDVILNLEEA